MMMRPRQEDGMAAEEEEGSGGYGSEAQVPAADFAGGDRISFAFGLALLLPR